MMFGYDSVQNHYKNNFALIHHHKYSITELENMIPWEKHLYIDMLQEFIKIQEEERRDREAATKRKR